MDINEETPLVTTTDRTTAVDTNPVATTTDVVITGTTSTPGTGLRAVLKSTTVSPPSYSRSISSPAVTGGRRGLQLRDTPQDMSTQEKQVKSDETCYVRGLNRSGGDCLVSASSRERLKQQEPIDDSQMSTFSDAAVGRYPGTSFTVVSPNFNFCGESLNTQSGDSHEVFWFTASPSKGDRDMKEEGEGEREEEGEVVKSKPLALVHSRGEGREEGRVMGEGEMCEDEREGNEEVAALAQQLQLDSDNVN